MKSSRRPFDRSREPDLKKARLARESENVRSFPQKPTAPGSNLVPSKFRAIDRDSESSDSGRGGYHPQPLQHHELLTRYKTALAELTFNSKPIITNLTIIAGENLHAARAIAATVCGNILEVPSDQKLPSLYLLDSIVKNIGRDYIKYFGMRLPEVFCKTYREVDPPVHQSMRHLFGTWKGVFSPQSLQSIEKDLGFIPAVNGSSSGAITSRPDSQSQRPPHSIHVNPKYLERQRLQQSSRVKEMTSDVIEATVDAIEDEERPERTTSISVGRPWDAPVQMPLSDRDAVSGDYEYGSEPKRNPGFGRRITEKGHDKYGYGVSSNVPETFSQRNGFATKDCPPTKSINTSALIPSVQILGGRNGSGLSSSWKNSEEEEFVWDDMNSRLTDHGPSSVTGDPRKDHWTPGDSDKLSFSNHLRDQPHGIQDVGARSDTETSSDLFPSDQRELGVYAQRRSSPWHSRDPRLLAEPIGSGTPRTSSDNSEGYVPNLSGISGASSAVAQLGGWSEKGPMGPLMKQRLQSLSAALPSVPSSLSRNTPSPSLSASSLSSHQLQSLIEKNLPQVRSQIHPDQKLSVSSVSIKVGQHKQYSPEINPANLEKASLSSQPRRDSVRSEPSGKGLKPLLPPPSSVQSGTTNFPVSGMKKSNNVVTSKPKIDGTTSSDPSFVEIPSLLENLSQTKVLPRSLPSTSLPSSSLVNSVSAETSDDLNKESQDPISSILSSLVSKGLISASKAESPSIVESQVPSLHENQDPVDTVPISTPFSSAPNSSPTRLSSTKVEIPSSQPADESSDVLPQTTTSAINNFIGFEFKPDIIRELHPSVIEGLLDDSPYQCCICGLHLKLQEQLDRHLHWHALKNPEADNLNKASRRWYARSSDWVARKAGTLSSEAEFADSEQDGSSNAIVMEDSEPMVPADENQFACVLCGELFEDVYNLERNEWMFKGAVYMSMFLGSVQSIGESSMKGPIVHANCITEDPALDDILTTVIKTENDI